MPHSHPTDPQRTYKQALRRERAAWDALLKRPGRSTQGLESLMKARMAANVARAAYLESMPGALTDTRLDFGNPLPDTCPRDRQGCC